MIFLFFSFGQRKNYPIFAHRFRALSSVGSEHLPYKQGVEGSNPSGPTKGRLFLDGLFYYRASMLRILDFCA